MLGDKQWEYNRSLADFAGVARQPPVIQRMYDDTSRSRRLDPVGYRTRNYHITSETEFRVSVGDIDETPPH